MTTDLAIRKHDLSTQQLGQILAKSGYFSDTRDEAQAIVKVLAGAELGFGPIASMQGIYIVKGRVTHSANLVAAAIQRSGKYRYEIKELTSDRAVLVFHGPHNSRFESEFTMADAEKASLATGNYKAFPRNMLFSRALTNGARWFCPEVFSGPVYTPDELGAEVDTEGNVLEIVGAAVAAAPQSEPDEATNDPLADALEFWNDACTEADRLGIKHKIMPADADLAKVERWTELLVGLITAAEVEKSAVPA